MPTFLLLMPALRVRMVS